MTRNGIAAFVTLVLLPFAGFAHAEDLPTQDKRALHSALGWMGIEAKDLGYRPKAHWPRYPHSKTVPYVMPFFDDLLANPLDTYGFTRTLGNAIEDFLTPKRLREVPKKGGKETLYKLGVMLATERRIGGFRVFGIDTAHLDSNPDEGETKTPTGETVPNALMSAVFALWKASGSIAESSTSLGFKQDVMVPTALHRPLAHLLLDLIDARQWIDKGLRHVTPKQREAVFATLLRLAESTPDGTEYFPVIDDVAKVIDEHSLHFGCLKALQAVQNARRRLGRIPVPEGGWPEFRWELDTKWGQVEFNSRDEPGATTNPFLVVDFGIADRGGRPLGATSPTRSLSVALLMGVGGDIVGGSSILVPDDEIAPVAGLASGILGCGIVYEAGGEDTVYRTERWGLGAGLFGLGALIDEGGDDSYELLSVGQGAAFFGAGLLLDAAGDDKYVLREGDGQGFGGPNGIGILGDRSGDDFYYAEPDALKAGRADYHSENEIAVSNAQGVGSGRRGDISDGHVWAGGLGALIDVEGDDLYRAGNFSQGLGYWYGTGLLWDGGGNDEYRSVYFTQGSGAHFAIGALIDEGGNDMHLLEKTAGAGLAFGWDVVNAFLIDRGNGNDRYEADRISIGVAEVRSNAFFIDEGGDDVYIARAKGKFFGDVDERKSYTQAGRTSDFTTRLAQVGVFLDLGGKDRYLRRKKNGVAEPDPAIGDGKTWNLRKAVPGASHAPNVSVGRDLSGGALAFLRSWPRRGAEKPADR